MAFEEQLCGRQLDREVEEARLRKGYYLPVSYFCSSLYLLLLSFFKGYYHEFALPRPGIR